jgi:hypothetical protein
LPVRRPHFRQNFEPSGISLPHAGQNILLAAPDFKSMVSFLIRNIFRGSIFDSVATLICWRNDHASKAANRFSPGEDRKEHSGKHSAKSGKEKGSRKND